MASRSSGTDGYLCPIRFSQPRPNVGPGRDQHGRMPDDVASGYLAVDREGHGQLGAREARGYLGPRTWPSDGRAGVATFGRSAVVQTRRERVVLHAVLVVGMRVSGSAALGAWVSQGRRRKEVNPKSTHTHGWVSMRWSATVARRVPDLCPPWGTQPQRRRASRRHAGGKECRSTR